jgi:hypothetical protein
MVPEAGMKGFLIVFENLINAQLMDHEPVPRFPS